MIMTQYMVVKAVCRRFEGTAARPATRLLGPAADSDEKRPISVSRRGLRRPRSCRFAGSSHRTRSVSRGFRPSGESRHSIDDSGVLGASAKVSSTECTIFRSAKTTAAVLGVHGRRH